MGNWTHRNKLGRIEILVGASYESDAKKVHQILHEIATAHPLVLKNPEPFVLFQNFADSSLNFEIRVFLADVSNGATVQNDIRFAVLEAFRREGIEIPFPQRDIHIRREATSIVPWPFDDDKAEMEAMELAQRRQQPAPKPKNGRRRKPDPT